MRRRDRSSSIASSGFSLVELLVALLFTALLMAGLATVFQSSLGTFVTSGEKISGARRNRMAADMIYDDLNAAGMLLTSLSDYGGTEAFPITVDPTGTNPPFQIIPNVPYTNTDVAAPNNVSDQLFLYFDEALPFEGTVGTPIKSAAEAGVDETPYDADLDTTVQLRDSTQADLVKHLVDPDTGTPFPLAVLFKADVAAAKKPASWNIAGKQVGLTMSADFTDPNSGPAKFRIPDGTSVLFVKPGLYVRYSIQPRNLDPDPANAGIQIPCLVRDEVLYSDSAASGNPTPFAAPLSSTIIAENVVGFQVMVSPNGGVTWANDPYDAGQRSGALPTAAAPGIPHTRHANWADISAILNASSAITGRPAPFNRVDDSRFWFKDIPVTVRVDITTRTARPRGEYLEGNPTTIFNGTRGIPYKIQTQSVVLVPRHFGLSYASGLL